MTRHCSLWLLVALLWTATTHALLEKGVWHLTSSPGHEYVGVTKSLFKGSHINIKVMCDPEDPSRPPNITISWLLRQTPCFNEYIITKDQEKFYAWYFANPQKLPSTPNGTRFETAFHKTKPVTYPCDHNIVLDEEPLDYMTGNSEAAGASPHAQATRQVKEGEADAAAAKVVDKTYLSSSDISTGGQARTNHPVTVVTSDGVYLLDIHITSSEPLLPNASYIAYVDIEIKSDYGYLSAANWPLLGFYGAMCVVYVVYGFVWLIISAMRWRELLRVQYWIGAVIFLGMLEMAMFTAEYSSLNVRGYSVSGLLIAAELVSSAKRTLARMLVIIVSLGFGIVKPRLGIVLHRVVGVGLIYFVLASIEGCTRALQPRSSSQNQQLLASLPLSLLESAICFWIFTAMVQTTRTLRLRHNLVKLSLYTHFTNTLAFALIASIIFMLWSIRYHQFEECLTDWKEFWVDEAYWHILFAILLLVIMILWRPSNNNQRFAFTPLLDDGSDADDEEESEKLMADISDTMKQRNTRTSTSSSPRDSRSVEDDLKWVEENIPSSFVDPVLPILDSEEEIVTTKFEVSKMQ